VPTKNIVTAFGDISADNRNIIMERIVEGVSLISVGVMVALVTYAVTYAVTYVDPVNPVTSAVYGVSAMVSFSTGFKVKFLLIKICPFVLVLSATLIIAGWMS